MLLTFIFIWIFVGLLAWVAWTAPLRCRRRSGGIGGEK
jgi:hypothetical protein